MAAGWAAGWWLLWRLPAPAVPISPAAPVSPVASEGRRRLTVVVAARDEEASLPALLKSLDEQTDPADEVIVIDDHSTDATADIARRAGATVLCSSPLPEGWTGKTWAMHQAAEMVTSGPDEDLLLFVDADVSFAPEALAALRNEHERRGGPITVEPWHVTERAYERLSAIANAVTLMGTGAFTGWPRRPAPMAFGPCLLVDVATYRESGGHGHPDVRRLIAEDIGLARRFHEMGRPVTAFAGRDLVRFRMYPGGISQLAEGWTKILAYGSARTPPLIAAATGLWVTGAILASGAGAGAALDLLRRRRPDRAVVLTYGAWSVQVGWMLRRIGGFGAVTPALFPVPLGAFLAFFARSWALRLTGRAPTWRGRVTPQI